LTGKSKKSKKTVSSKKDKKTNNQYTSLAFITEDNIKSIIRIDNKIDITQYYVRSWINRKKKPYKYEFRGEYAAYHNPEQLDITYNE